MNKIRVKILNPGVLKNAEKMMVCGARLTQGGHKIKTVSDFMALYDKPHKEATAKIMYALPHPTIQKFGVVNIVVVGASRRFLAQITRHQNEVKFMSASCQYSDWGEDADFVVPSTVKGKDKKAFLDSCKASLAEYRKLTASGVDHDEASFVLPQALRNVLIISATPYQIKHMIKQRVCRRNSIETRLVMMLILRELFKVNPLMFADAMPDCCTEGKFSCGRPMKAKGVDLTLEFINDEIKDILNGDVRRAPNEDKAA